MLADDLAELIANGAAAVSVASAERLGSFFDSVAGVDPPFE